MRAGEDPNNKNPDNKTARETAFARLIKLLDELKSPSLQVTAGVRRGRGAHAGLVHRNFRFATYCPSADSMAAATCGESGVTAGSNRATRLPVAADQELGEVPLDVAAELRIFSGAGQVLVERRLVVAFD